MDRSRDRADQKRHHWSNDVPTHDYKCVRCLTIFEERHSIKESPPSLSECPECGGTAHRQFSTPAFNAKGDDLLDNGKPQYCPALARKMPYNKDDPKAFFTSKRAAREAARRKADTGDYTLTLD